MGPAVTNKCSSCHAENPEGVKFCGECGTQLPSSKEFPASQTMTLQTRLKVPAKGMMVAGKYRIVEPIGKGGMGVVYRAEDTKLERAVALKFLPPELTEDPEARERFVREAKAAAALSHPHICTVYEINDVEKESFIVMEFIDGQSLKQKIAQKTLAYAEALDIAIQVAEGLEEAHKKGIVHRDIKPGNIMMTANGQAKITDFGLAKIFGRSLITREARTMGTVAYMSPEQAQGQSVDHRTDIWSLGVMLYEMLAGKLPFRGEYDQSIIHSILNHEPDPVMKVRRDLPAGLETAIAKALAKKPVDRYQTMAEFLEDLRALAAGYKPLRAKPRWLTGRILGLRKTSAYAGLAGLAVLIVLGLVIILSGRHVLDSIAVLPLQNLSGDPQQEYFSDGLTEDLTAKLAEINALKVISQTSVVQYKGTKKPLPQIARELNVKAVITGSVAREGGIVRVTAHLIQASTDRHLWAGTYERDLQSVLVLRSEIASAIAEKIRATMTPAERARMVHTRPVDPEAYDATLNGKAVLEYATRVDQFRQAIELFQKAIDRDPTYAPAWAGLGEATWSPACTGWEAVAPAEVRAKAIAAAQKALELDETLPEAHKARAFIAWDGEWDLAKAQRHYERALELRPGYAAAHTQFGQLLGSVLLHFDEARPHLDRARELDPLTPWNDINLVAWWLYQGRLEKALEEGKRARGLNPTLWIIPWQMGFARLLLGQPNQALTDFEAAVEAAAPERPAAVLAPLGLAYGLAGRRDDALRILTEMEQAAEKRYVSPFFLAVAYSGVGRMDEAFRLLDRALEQKTPWLANDAPAGEYDAMNVALRRDPRWKPFIDRLRRLVRLPAGSPNSHS